MAADDLDDRRRFDRGAPDRRSPAGSRIAPLLLETDEPVPFERLEDEAADVADVAEVAGWVGNAVGEGLVEDLPSQDGRRRFRLRRRGKAALTRGRRATDA